MLLLSSTKLSFSRFNYAIQFSKSFSFLSQRVASTETVYTHAPRICQTIFRFFFIFFSHYIKTVCYEVLRNPYLKNSNQVPDSANRKEGLEDAAVNYCRNSVFFNETRYTLVFLIVLFVISVSCGLQKDVYVDYKEGADSSEVKTTEETECAVGLTAFTDNIAPSIGTCASSSCHLVTPIGGTALKQDDNSFNRTVFLAYDSSADGSTLFNKISGTHGGGDQSGVMSQDSIKLWKDGEAGCNTQP